MQPSKDVYPIEKIISAASYVTSGLAGFIWLIIAALCKKHVTQFLLYHILQSIFLSILYYLLVTFINLIYIVIARIPIINTIPYVINMPIPLFFGLSILQLITTGIIIYLVLTALVGRYSYLPWVSNIINAGIGRNK